LKTGLQKKSHDLKHPIITLKFLDSYNMNLTSVLEISENFRILMEQSGVSSRAKWFGEDGRLVALPDPILKRPTRPPILDESDAVIEPDTFFCPPFMGGQSGADDITYGKFSGLSHCQLDVSLKTK